MLQEGQKFGEHERYELVKQLGRGGFSEVWLAEDTKAHVQVALKVYAPGTGLDDAGIELFTQEFSIVFDMNHTNLLKPTHFDNYERQPYLIMPLCKNGSAFKYVAGKETITEEQCWNLLHDVAAGLAYLHAKNPPLIHQDIKPDNILISDEGLYMITDFGISARVRSTIRSGMAAQEQSGGTLAYMGPERFSSQPRPIMASDIWSLGAMMYEIICGQPPFGNNGGLMQKKGAEIPIIEEEGYSQELKDIIYSCLNEEPANRPWARTIEEITYKHIHGLDMPMPQAPYGTMPQQGMNGTVNMNGTLNPMQNMNGTLNPAQNMGGTVNPVQNMGGTLNPAQNMGGTVNPVQSSVQPWQQSNGQPQQKKSNTKLYAIIGAVAAVVLVILGIALSGGSDEKEAEATPEETVADIPQVNLDENLQTILSSIDGELSAAAKFKEEHPGDLLNSDNGKVEDYFVQTLKYYNDYEELANSNPGSQLKDQNLKAQLDQKKLEAEQNLRDISLQMDASYQELQGLDANLAAAMKTRMDDIKQYIK